ncbi:MAG: ABC transporter ATP-binding protein [Thermogutta sp.]|nr:ABC transporter ATP-binding protein [Thermogutta sp.]
MAELVLEGVTKNYPTRAEPLTVLRGIDLRLRSGERVAVIGPSGSGKSTLLNIIGGMDVPSSGHVLLNGEDPARLPPDALARFRGRRIGFVFQDHHLLPQCSVLENVLIPVLAEGRVGEEDVRQGRELLERVGLASRTGHLPSELSGGERQRTAIARALIRRPLLILADEPTGNLDAGTAEHVRELLFRATEEFGTMLILVTHNERLAAAAERVFRLEDGRLQPAAV